ncbi:hypothetical protein [Streptomyces sp. BE133]|uniref:hypothetical protein n=1 Tax=Streptomyces sp. BE133 TaxID=3002523 RepID=UPI002E792447|nr:hypothetical protein [Streptomyces sp. BE133]MEE1808550.1 hypothetical protein [Streptomyces sp. BE133]
MSAEPADPLRLDGWIAPAIVTVAAVILSCAALMIVLFALMGPGSCDAQSACSWGAGATRNIMWTAARAILYVTPLGLFVTWVLPWRSRWTAARRRAAAFALLPHAVIAADLLPLLVFSN